IHELVREHVLARRIVDDDWGIAHHRREIVKSDRVHTLPTTDADSAKLSLPVAPNNAVDVLAAVGRHACTDDIRGGGLQISHDSATVKLPAQAQSGRTSPSSAGKSGQYTVGYRLRPTRRLTQCRPSHPTQTFCHEPVALRFSPRRSARAEESRPPARLGPASKSLRSSSDQR